MSASVLSEAAQLALASDVMLAAAAATVVTGDVFGAVIHRRAIQPWVSWKQSVVASAHQSARPLSRVWASSANRFAPSDALEAVAHRTLRATAIFSGLAFGLLGLAFAVASGHLLPSVPIVAGAIILSAAAAIIALPGARSPAVRAVLSRRGIPLLAAACIREFISAGAIVIVVLIVAHTAGLTDISAMEVLTIALVTRLVIAAVPGVRGFGPADVTLVAGLELVAIPLPVAVAAVLIWRSGSLLVAIGAAGVASRTAPAAIDWDSPAREGAGRQFHRAAFAIIGLLPDQARDRARSWIFDTMFALSTDPWGYQDAPYEQRKQAHLIAAVDCKARVIVEVGCADGHNLIALAQRMPAATIVGTDVSGAAVRIAANRTRELHNVSVIDASDRQALHRSLPGSVDCFVLAEVLYYLGGDYSMSRSLAPLREVLAVDGRVIMIHGSADAFELHSRAAAILGLQIISSTSVDDPERPFDVAILSLSR
ncbi:MAG: methyltransferase [Candidatus Nanopelagicales bacterium]|nr:methyltransferase [Candidatus Nanopelagicales bacterium]